MKGLDSPRNLNELQVKMVERANHREKLFSENPEKKVLSYYENLIN